MATIRKRQGRWQAQVRKDGHRLSRTFQFKQDAEKWAADRERQIERGELPSPTGRPTTLTTLGDILSLYLSEITPRKRSARQETWRIGRLQRHPIAALPIKSLKAPHIAIYRDQRLQRVSSQTVRHELNVLLHALKVGRTEWGLPIELAAFQQLTKPPQSPARERRLAPKEWRRLQDELASGSYARGVSELIVVALETGLRKGELLGLRQRDLDLVRQRLLVREAKNGHPRTVPLSKRALRCLETLRSDDAGTVFPISAAQLRRSWERLCQKCSLVNFHFHDLRHEAISRLFERNLSLPQVALISGHRDIKMLMRYTHLQIDDDIFRKLSNT